MLLEDGKERAPRGLKTISKRNVLFILKDPGKAVVTLPERELSQDYLSAEFEWYCSGSRDVESISEHASFWKGLVNPDGRTVNSNYGRIALHLDFNGENQLERCSRLLKEDRETRQALIVYHLPGENYPGNRDVVCALTQNFWVSEEGKLNSRVEMRSNDLIWGWCYDVPWFVYVQERLAENAGIEVGEYQHHALDLHAYERHFDMLRAIANHKEDPVSQ